MGESHCLALTQDCRVYAWGLNNMGQCGLGHNAPVTVPQKIKALEGYPIHQISAGTSHSMAWTALPPDSAHGRTHTLKWQKPFCVDVSEDTFKVMCQCLKDFGLKADWSQDNPVVSDNSQEAPRVPTDSLRVFRTLADRQEFITNFIHLLTPHLILASNENKSLEDQQESSGSKSHCLTGHQRASMENVLYQFMDLSSCPPVVKDIVQV